MSQYNQRLDGRNPLSYVGVNPYTPVPLRVNYNAPTAQDSQNVSLGTLWLQQGTSNIWILTSLSQGVATWTPIGSGSGGTNTYVTDSGTATSVAGSINIIGSGTTTTSGSGDTVTINSTGGSSGTPDSFNAVLTSPQTITASTSATIIFNTLVINNGGGYNTATGVYTVPVTGLWRINTQVYTSSGTPGSGALDLVVNGTLHNSSSALNLDISQSIDTLISFTAGDMVSVLYTAPSGSDITIGGSTAPSVSWFEAYQVTGGGGGGGGSITIAGDTGTPQTGTSFTFEANSTAGGSVNFNAAATDAITLHVTDVNNNTLVGLDAGVSGTTGVQNTALGSSALAFITTASGNTTLGYQAGYSLLTGTSNVLVGNSAGTSYTGNESGNILIGANVGGSTAENDVTRIGNYGSQTACYIAGINGVTVSNLQYVTINTATGQLGSGSGSSSSITITGDSPFSTPQTGNNFTFLANNDCGSSVTFTAQAVDTIQLQVTNSFGTFIGALAGANVTTGAARNVGIGGQALNALTTGVDNTAVGRGAGITLTTGSNNTLIGDVAGNGLTTGSENIIIGVNFTGTPAVGTYSSNTIIGNGTAEFCTTGSGNTIVGTGSAAGLTTGASNTLIGNTVANSGWATGSFNTIIGEGSGANYTSNETGNIILNSPGVIGDMNTMRLGNTSTTTSCFLAGTYGVTPSGTLYPVVINSSGQVGYASSGTGIVTIDGDTGSVTGTTVSIKGASTAGSSVAFTGSGTAMTLAVTDSLQNTLMGTGAGNNSLTGGDNTGLGYNSLHALTNGPYNTGLGWHALMGITTGQSNVAVGRNAGSAYTSSESNNICIGSGVLGVAAESNTIRIGFQGTQTAAYIAGITGVTVGNENLVTINTATGQLGSSNLPIPGVSWHTVTGSSQALATLQGYFANYSGTTTFALPALAAEGDTYEIANINNATGFTVSQNAGQSIRLGSSVTTTGVGGSLSSTEIGDVITIVCYAANTGFIVTSSIGNITVV